MKRQISSMLWNSKEILAVHVSMVSCSPVHLGFCKKRKIKVEQWCMFKTTEFGGLCEGKKGTNATNHAAQNLDN